MEKLSRQVEKFIFELDLAPELKGHIIGAMLMAKAYPCGSEGEMIMLLLDKAIESIIDLREMVNELKGE